VAAGAFFAAAGAFFAAAGAFFVAAGAFFAAAGAFFAAAGAFFAAAGALFAATGALFAATGVTTSFRAVRAGVLVFTTGFSNLVFICNLLDLFLRFIKDTRFVLFTVTSVLLN
jgi:hypothetical protein